MRIGKVIVIILALTNSISLFGSCHGERFSITELLNHDPQNHHIFSCEILETYMRGTSYESIAVVKKRFKGVPNDTVFIHSGGGTTAGGEKLYLNSEWLIFSRTKDSLHYGATVCDYLSCQISKVENEKRGNNRNSFAKVYLDILKEYELIKENRFSGYKEIRVEEKLIAKGSFLNGLPHGNWIHYSRYDRFEKRIKRSEISYENGMLEGMYHLYFEDEKQNIIIERRRYRFNLPELIEWEGVRQKRFEYKDENERHLITTFSDSSGTLLKKVYKTELNYRSKRYNSLSFKHGYYFNKFGRDSSQYSPLGEGHYFRGARVGEWKFFNKKGETIETKTFPDRFDDLPQIQIRDEKGNVRLSGLYVDGKRIGVWKMYYDKRLEYEEVYDSKGDKISKIQFYSSGGMELTNYSKNLEDGPSITFNKDKTINSIRNYKNGSLNGISIFFNSNGTIKKESNFINAREYTVNRQENKSYFSNGFLNGHFVQYNYKTGEKRNEGDYWNGYRTGVWIEYGRKGRYRKMYYPTEKEELMNQHFGSMAKLIEQYDKEGNLMRSWKN